MNSFSGIRTSSFGVSITILLMGCSITTLAQNLSVMSYNIRLDLASDGQDAWPQRREALADHVAWLSPDVLGVQEALPHQLEYLYDRLPSYSYVGRGRRAEAGDEATAIFYNRHRFELVHAHTFWLSPTPDTVSIAWGANLPRIATYARLAEKSSGREFMVVNTHLDHESQLARIKSIQLVKNVIDSIAPPDLPVVLMGDFNAEPDNEAMQQLADNYTDAFHAVTGPRTGPRATFSTFDPDEQTDRRIDYILLRKNVPIKVDNFATIPWLHKQRFLSDHLPVMAELTLAPQPIIIGHRGARGHATENSLASIQAALDLGVDMIEIDVFRLRDGEIVVFHDATLERLTDGRGSIEALTLPELNQLLLAGAHRIPRLRDVLTLINHRVRVNVELKGANTAGGTYQVLQDFVEHSGYRWQDFTISSFAHDELRKMRELDSSIDIGILPTGPTLEALRVAEEVGATSINPNHQSLTQTIVDTIHDAGYLVYPWTVNDPEDIARVKALGVDGIITDYPERAK